MKPTSQIQRFIRYSTLIAFSIPIFAPLSPAFAQGMRDNVTDQFLKTVTYVIGITHTTSNTYLVSKGTGTLYGIPVRSGQLPTAPDSLLFPHGKSVSFLSPNLTATNTEVVCLVTAKHNLYSDPDTATNLHSAIILRFNRFSTENAPAYVFIPLKRTEPRNFWTSERGRDLAVIPLPREIFSGADFIETSPDKILTTTNFQSLEVLPGAVVIACVVQYEYLTPEDLQAPVVMPLLRCAHLSRLGLYGLHTTNAFLRSHVVDLHASHGNSGAPVWLFTKTGEPILLGLIESFKEEFSPKTVEAPVTEKFVLALPEIKISQTNLVAQVPLPEANPALTFVTPVDELVAVCNSTNLPAILSTVDSMKHEYRPLPPTPSLLTMISSFISPRPH